MVQVEFKASGTVNVADFVLGVIRMRDLDLCAHHQRVGDSVEPFGKALGFSEKDIELLSMGARIHDIGKLSVHDEILHKPAFLTKDEFALIKKHTESGRDLLAPLGLDARILDMVYHHHENYDGTGYPDGLSATDIPVLARVLRIADSYDAITNDTSYHKGISPGDAMRMMERESRYYDPKLLESFFRITRATPGYWG
ncbi:MAG: HD domain-containing protein [Gammaproteobacteria bacterium]|nr:HD domain-containing protein [Gammaproteobacteria bacterium]